MGGGRNEVGNDFAKPQQEKRKQRKASPIEAKESFRWLAGLRQARQIAQQLPDQCVVNVADSESDIYHVFAEPRGARPVHWLIWACQERNFLAGLANRKPPIFSVIIVPRLLCDRRPDRCAVCSTRPTSW
jgi:hypothetical protein